MRSDTMHIDVYMHGDIREMLHGLTSRFSLSTPYLSSWQIIQSNGVTSSIQSPN